MSRPASFPLIVSAGILSISTAAIFIKLCDDAPPAVIAAARLAVASMVLVPGGWIVRRGRPFTIRPGQGRYLFLSGVFLAAHFYAWVSSLKHTSVLSSVVLVTVNPLFVGVASYFLFKERLHRNLIAGLALAAIGVGLISWSDSGSDSGSLTGDALALAGALMASCYMLVGRKLRREMDVLSYTIPVYGVAAILLIALAAASGHAFTGYTPRTYLCFLLLGLVPQLLGHSVLNWALRYVSATTVAVFILGEPIGASLFAYFALDESITGMQAAGGGLILAGLVLASRQPSNRPHDEG